MCVSRGAIILQNATNAGLCTPALHRIASRDCGKPSLFVIITRVIQFDAHGYYYQNILHFFDGVYL